MNLDDIKLKKEALNLQIIARAYVKKTDIVKDVKKTMLDFKSHILHVARITSTDVKLLTDLCDDLVQEILQNYEQ